jgi:hypothetical protein
VDRLGRDPHYTFRFADDRIIPRFHLEGIGAGVRISVFRMHPTTGKRLGLRATATVGEVGWVGRGSTDHRAGGGGVHRRIRISLLTTNDLVGKGCQDLPSR